MIPTSPAHTALCVVLLMTTLFPSALSKYCSAGYYDRSGTCTACPVNTYKGEYSAAISCTQCPANSNTNGLTGRTAISECKCAAGYTGSTSTGCTACPVGTYKASTGNDPCTQCPSNSNTNGLTVRTTCQCIAGYSGFTAAGCTQCVVGTYKGSIGNMACTPCPAGSNTNGLTGQTDISACQCAEGYYGFSSNSSLSCTRCPAGTYKSEAGNGEASKVCLTCGVDTYSEAGSTICNLCPVSSSTNNETKQMSCNYCNKGYHGTPTSPGGCTTCPSGTYKPTVGNGLASDVCVSCPVNTFSATSGTSTCMACPPHSTTNNQTGQTSCLCDIGYYGDGKTICQKCPAGTKKANVGNGEVNDVCKPCDINSYSLGGNAVCTVCPVNSNTMAETGQGTCQCNPGYYGDGINSCSACLAGTSKQYPGNGKHNDVCLPCNKGTFSSSNASTICASCPPHSTTLGTSGQTACVCAAGRYGDGTTCDECPVGTYKDMEGNGKMDEVCVECKLATFPGSIRCGVAETSPTPPPAPSNESKTGLIAGLSAAGGLLFLVTLSSSAVVYFKRKAKERKQLEMQTLNSMMPRMEGEVIPGMPMMISPFLRTMNHSRGVPNLSTSFPPLLPYPMSGSPTMGLDDDTMVSDMTLDFAMGRGGSRARNGTTTRINDGETTRTIMTRTDMTRTTGDTSYFPRDITTFGQTRGTQGVTTRGEGDIQDFLATRALPAPPGTAATMPFTVMLGRTMGQGDTRFPQSGGAMLPRTLGKNDYVVTIAR